MCSFSRRTECRSFSELVDFAIYLRFGASPADQGGTVAVSRDSVK
jgi:hypothetical protein